MQLISLGSLFNLFYYVKSDQSHSLKLGYVKVIITRIANINLVGNTWGLIKYNTNCISGQHQGLVYI